MKKDNTLQGVRVLSLALNLPGPAALLRVAQMGAKCTKVNPPNGDPMALYTQQGIAYVPERRGIFGNLSVVENLQMAARPGTKGQRDWTYDRVLETFPRLKERLGHGGQQLSAASNKC